MKAMILAAGLGTRLRPLTENKPKALIKINGITLLELVVRRLKQFNVNEIIINVHHFADQIIHFLKQKNNFHIRIEISREDILLDTGGGLKKAGWFFDDGKPFLLHNVDVLTDLDFNTMFNAHQQSQALATLAVRKRKTSRYLLFDQMNQLCGWKSNATKEIRLPRKPEGDVEQFSFMGIHILSPDIIGLLEEKGPFSIIDAYLHLSSQGKTINAFSDDQSRWLDLGKIENFEQAAHIFSDIFL